nr:MAG TPA: Integrin beta-2 beta2, hybrid domain, PSI [Caudoviricetes sp.]
MRFNSSCSNIRKGETIKYNLRLTTTSLLIHT